MKKKTTELPYWLAWKNVMPGPDAEPFLHIRGCVFSDLFQQPYLKPLKTPLLFELKFRPLKRPPHFPIDLELPKEVEPYNYQGNFGDGKFVSIKIPKQKKPIQVPLKSISYEET